MAGWFEVDEAKDGPFKWNRFRLAPAIATFIIVISFHILFFLDDPLQFLIGLITPSIIFSDVGAHVCCIGCGLCDWHFACVFDFKNIL